MARPRPVPPKRRVVEVSACSKAANSWPSLSAAMPMPVSRTAKRRRSPPASWPSSSTRSTMRAVLGELDRVAQQVEQRLRQPRRVAAQRGGHARRRRMPSARPLACARSATRRGVRASSRASEKSVCSSSSLPASIFDRSRMSLMTCSRWLGGVGDLVQAVDAAPASRGVAAQQVRQADDGVHRRADLVAHVGQEGALGAVGGLGAVARQHQLGIGLLQLLLGLLDLGDVGHQHQEAAHLAVDQVGDVVGQAVHACGRRRRAARAGNAAPRPRSTAGSSRSRRCSLLGAEQLGQRDAVHLGRRCGRTTRGRRGWRSGSAGPCPSRPAARLVVGHGADEALAVEQRPVELAQLRRALVHQLLQVVAVAVEFGADALLLGDVLADRQVVRDASVGLADRRRVHELVVGRAVLARVAELARPDLAARQRREHLASRARPGARRLQHVAVLADRFVAREAADAREGVVDVLDAAVGVADDDADRALLDRHRQLAQLLLRGVALGDVAERHHHRVERAAVRVVHRLRVHHAASAARRRGGSRPISSSRQGSAGAQRARGRQVGVAQHRRRRLHRPPAAQRLRVLQRREVAGRRSARRAGCTP